MDDVTKNEENNENLANRDTEVDEAAIAADAENLSKETPPVEDSSTESDTNEEAAVTEPKEELLPEEPEESTEEVPESMPEESEQVQEEPADEPASEPVKGQSIAEVAAKSAKAEAEEKTVAEEAASEAKQMNLKKSSKMPLVIVFAILVALVLIGLAYAAFISGDESNKLDGNDNINTSQELEESDAVNSQPIDSQELQADIEQLEQDINSLDDTTDFDSQDLTDESLDLQ